MIARRQREKGLGPLHTVSLKEAGSRALDCRRMKLNGIDPLEARRAARAAARLEQARSIKFKEAAAQSMPPTRPPGKTQNMPSSGPARVRNTLFRSSAICRSGTSMLL